MKNPHPTRSARCGPSFSAAFAHAAEAGKIDRGSQGRPEMEGDKAGIEAATVSGMEKGPSRFLSCHILQSFLWTPLHHHIDQSPRGGGGVGLAHAGPSAARKHRLGPGSYFMLSTVRRTSLPGGQRTRGVLHSGGSALGRGDGWQRAGPARVARPAGGRLNCWTFRDAAKRRARAKKSQALGGASAGLMQLREERWEKTKRRVSLYASPGAPASQPSTLIAQLPCKFRLSPARRSTPSGSCSVTAISFRPTTVPRWRDSTLASVMPR